MTAGRFGFFVLMGLVLWGLIVSVEARSGESDPCLTIRSFKIFGARTVTAKAVWEEMMTPRPSFWPWKKPPTYDPEELKLDLERIQALYRREGFYHTRIVPEVKKLPDNQVEIRLNITEGVWVRVDKVNLSVAAAAEPINLTPILQETSIKPGQRFTESGYEDLKKQIMDYLLDNGYPKARVEGEVAVYPERNLAKVNVQAWPGLLCRFGAIKITGEDLETPETLIRRCLTFHPGEIFSLEKIYDSQSKLYALDLFQSVMVTPEKVPPGQTEIPITVTLKEKKKRSLKLGAGYGSEDEFRGRAILRFRNLAGGGRLLDLYTKYSRLETRMEGSFYNPLFLCTFADLNINGGVLRRYLPGFTDRSFYSREVLEREFPWKIKGYIGHGLEFSRPFNIPIESLELLTETEPGKTYQSSMLLWGLSRDSTDNPADPQRGGLMTLSGEYAPDFLGSRLQFIHSLMEVRHYQNLGRKNLVLAGRVKFGLINPIQETAEIPIVRRFFSGGMGSVRGYRLDYLGPRNPAGDPLGGNSLLEGGLEFRFPIFKELRGVAFMDCGNVFLEVDDTDLGQLKYGAGFGLRYQTPVGPVGLDVAFPLNPIDRERDDYQIYFTIGQAF
ncbi:MAG: BamA/TamA family outer membrane protein [Deltaproteobacteria bacterium]|nr:BamA/TamA family outer membrane protein [Deltaproteobacteria bacterium]